VDPKTQTIRSPDRDADGHLDTDVTAHDVALAALAAGLSVCPPVEDGTKAPEPERLTRDKVVEIFGADKADEILGGKATVLTWKHREVLRADREQIDRWYKGGRTGVGIVCGPVSGNLEMLEFEDADVFQAFKDTAEAAGLGELVERLETGYSEVTPRGGRHLPYRCSEIAHNTKLAQRPGPLGEDGKPTRKAIIETRGEGGYFIAAPSNGRVHPNGGQYRLLRGGVDTIATITPEERSKLFDLARAFDEIPRTVADEHDRGKNRQDVGGGDRPGDRFNASATWDDVLAPLGWVAVYRRGATTYWRRPGKDRGISATTNWQGSGYLYVFSTSTEFDSERGYSKFGAYAILSHNGDFSAAAKELATREELSPQASSQPDYPVPPTTIKDVLATFQRWLYMPDTGALEVAIAAYVSNHGNGNPIWLLIVGGSGYGKTESINPLTRLPHAFPVGIFTEASLLSGTPRKDRSQGASGGLLRQIGKFGIIVLKDFGSILSMQRDARAAVLAALREMYDGRWTRYVGSDGGRQLDWEGKVGLIGGCTPAIDEHHAVMSVLGERFILYRLPALEDDQQVGMASSAIDLTGSEETMRDELATSVKGLFPSGTVPETAIVLSTGERSYLITLAQFTVKTRAPIIRDTSPSRAIDLVPGHEAPTRFSICLLKLLGGLIAIGVERPRAWELLRKVALDSTPQLRRRAIEVLASANSSLSTTEIAECLSHPTNTVRRALEDLEAYQLIHHTTLGQGVAHVWALSDWLKGTWATIANLPIATVPEMSEGVNSMRREQGGCSHSIILNLRT
jgi:hypothetical protein